MSNESKTPAYVGYGTFKNQITGLEHVPDTVDYSVFPTMGGSTRSAFFSALRFFGLTDGESNASDALRQLASADDAKWKAVMKPLIEQHYTESQLSVLKSGTMNALKKSFEDVGTTIVPSACRFLIMAAKDVGIPVSGTIAKTKVGGPARKSGGNKSKPKPNGSTPRQQARDEQHEPPAGTITFPIHIPGKPQGSITVPMDIDANDLPMFKAIVSAVEAYASRQGGTDA